MKKENNQFISLIKAIFDLLRITLGILAAVVVFVAAYLTYRLNEYNTGNAQSIIEFFFNNPVLPPDGVMLGLLIPFLLTSANQVINDVFDYESDLQNNRMDRPLVRGVFGIKTAKNIATGLYLSAFIVGLILFFVPRYSIDIIIPLCIPVLIAMGISYNYGIKKIGLLGNMWVSAGYAIPFLLGAFLIRMNNDWVVLNIMLLSIFVFFLGLGREILKDIMDIEGDKEIGMKSVAIVMGVRWAVVLSSISFGITIILGLSLCWLGLKNNPVYLPAVTILSLLLIYTDYIMLTSKDPITTGVKARKYTRWSLWIATLSILVSAFFIP